MAEYIERESLLKEMLGLHSTPVYIGHVTDEDKMFETMVDVVKEHPTADVVPVVRCKNCIHYQNEWCEILKAESPVEDGFCCYGERRCEE